MCFNCFVMVNCSNHQKPCSSFIIPVHQADNFSELAELRDLYHEAMRKEIITNNLTIYWDFLSICCFKPLKIKSQSGTLH